jgi:hypothetical protein
MQVRFIRPGLAVYTAPDSKTRILGWPKDTRHRRAGRGVVQKKVKSGGRIWWVKHSDGNLAPYAFFELEPVPDNAPDEEPGLFPLGKE